MMKLKRGLQIRIIILFTLIVIAFYQVFSLFFTDIFTTLNNTFVNQDVTTLQFDTKDYFTKPAIIGVSVNTDTEPHYYVVKKTTIYFEGIYDSVIQLIQLAMQNAGEEVGELDEKPVGRRILWKYTFDMNSNDFFNELGLDLPKKLENLSFRQLEIQFEGQNFTMLFYNAAGKMIGSRKVVLTNTPYFDQLIAHMDKVNETGEIKYTFIDDKTLLSETDRNLLPLPDSQWRINAYLYFYNPLVNEQGHLDELKVKSFAVKFFEYTDKIWEVKPKENYLFGNQFKTLSIYLNGFMQYKDEEVYKKQATTLRNSYYLALQFMKKDKEISNVELQLQEYQKVPNGYVFYFGYRVNDIDIYYDQHILERDKMTQPMQVTVVNNQVVLYKRYLLQSDENLGQNEFLNLNYEDIYKVTESGLVNPPISDLNIGYLLSDEDLVGQISWVIWDENEKYFSPIR